MRRVTIVVIGNAKTTRNNVEALISDVVDSVDEADIAVVYDKVPSDGQTWAAQWAQDNGLQVLQYEENGWDNLIATTSVDDLRFFILWDDDDPACQQAASVAQEHKIPCYDLTDGLVLIRLNAEPIAKPAVSEPPIEEITPESEIVEDILEEPLEIDEVTISFDDMSDSQMLGELAEAFIEQAATVFARKFAVEFIKLLKEAE
jgi:hypothetical protein